MIKQIYPVYSGNTTSQGDPHMADETVKTEPASLAETSGLTMADAVKAITDLRLQFEAQNKEMQTLRGTAVAQQALIEKMGASKAAARFGSVPIEKRICNNCGTEVAEGKRCPRHKGEKINEIGMGMHHNRMQPIIIRQV